MTPSSKAWFETPIGQRYEVPAADAWPVVIGRASRTATPGEGAKLEIPQSEHTMTVSRRHALLYCGESGDWEIEDAGSTAGMTLGGARLEKGQRIALPAGAELTLGNFELTFHTAAETASAPTRTDVKEEPDSNKTMVVGDFVPSAAPDWFTKEGEEKSGDETPADMPEQERVYLDLWLEGAVTSVEIPQPAGVRVWTIGRAPKAPSGQTDYERHVALPDTSETGSMSRIHARLSKTDEAWALQNQSRQGLFVKGRTLKGEDQTALEPGDPIAMGVVVLIFRKGPIAEPYQASDFELKRAVGGSEHEVTPEEADNQDTRPLPKGMAEALRTGGDEDAQPWGFLTENKLVEPIRFALTKRRTRIGSHPLNSEIKMEGAGITDNYAVIQWGARDVRITSKNNESPVRVNHTAYRTSPPLKTGDIVSLGTREFRMDIVGEPPVATSSLVSQRIRRMVVASIIIVNLVFFGGLFAIKRLVPDPVSAQPPRPPDPKTLVANVVRNQGLAGLALLEDSEVGHGELGREYEPVLDALRTLNEAHRLIHKLPANTFDDNVATIEDDIEKGRKVFAMVGLDPKLASDGWFEKDILDVFQARRESAYGTQWTDFLRSLELTNIANARNQLNQMTHFPQAKLKAARDIVNLWVKISEAARAKNEGDILREFRRACTQSKSYAYIGDERERLAALNKDFQRIVTDTSEPARALARSDRWKQYHAHARSLLATLSLLDYYQGGDVDKFFKAVDTIEPGDQSALIATMKENLREWVAWQKQYGGTKDPLSDFRLLADLQQLQLKFQATLDQQCPLARTIDKRVESFQGARVKQAERLRAQADAMPNSFEKLDKLISAYDYDPNDEALEALDAVATRLCGRIQQEGSAAAHRKQLESVLARYQKLAEKGVLTLDHIVSGRQMTKLLNSAGR